MEPDFCAWLLAQLTFREKSARGGRVACAPPAPALSRDSRRGFPQRPGRRQPPARLAHLPDLAQLLISARPRRTAAESLGGDLKAAVYALDSPTIDLCLSLFPLGRVFAAPKANIKLHTLLDLRDSIPAFIPDFTRTKQANVRVLDRRLILEPGSFYVMDRGYVDFQRLYAFVLAAAFFC